MTTRGSTKSKHRSCFMLIEKRVAKIMTSATIKQYDPEGVSASLELMRKSVVNAINTIDVHDLSDAEFKQLLEAAHELDAVQLSFCLKLGQSDTQIRFAMLQSRVAHATLQLISRVPSNVSKGIADTIKHELCEPNAVFREALELARSHDVNGLLQLLSKRVQALDRLCSLSGQAKQHGVKADTPSVKPAKSIKPVKTADATHKPCVPAADSDDGHTNDARSDSLGKLKALLKR